MMRCRPSQWTLLPSLGFGWVSVLLLVIASGRCRIAAEQNVPAGSPIPRSPFQQSSLIGGMPACSPTSGRTPSR